MDSKNLLLVAALSGLAFAASAKDAPKTSAPIKEATSIEGECHGINSCKGTSACHTESNSCAGTNSCKGKGWLKTSEKECKDKKGTFKKA
ncbi:MAG: hypothetical protein EHM20_12140 [Alphaproteobacteria bacterium]|nr:MAG: hypothetical protein EHM20_12140 [Alphaproteobacteria bacterium]